MKRQTCKAFIISAVGMSALLICLMSVVWFGKQAKYYKYPAAKEFNKRVSEARASNRNITLAELVPFEWEKVCFVYPYTSAARISTELGGTYKVNPVDNQVDGAFYLVFALPDNTTLPVRVPRGFFRNVHALYCVAYEEVKDVVFRL